MLYHYLAALRRYSLKRCQTQYSPPRMVVLAVTAVKEVSPCIDEATILYAKSAVGVLKQWFNKGRGDDPMMELFA
jgi:hypothetical protein